MKSYTLGNNEIEKNHIDQDIAIRTNIDGGFGMQTVTVSSKYQVVIPKAVREAALKNNKYLTYLILAIGLIAIG